MINILMYISSGLIIIPFICYGLFIISSKNKKITDDNGFNITKDIISEYDSINIIENAGKMTYYNPKRGVIKLNNRCYYGNDLGVIAISLLESGISVIDKKNNKYLNVFKLIFNNLKLLYIFPIISQCINTMTYTYGDAKIGIVFVIINLIITYMFNDILINAFNWVSDNIKRVKAISKDNKISVIDYIKNIINLNKFIFFGELLIIIRMVAIMLSM